MDKERKEAACFLSELVKRLITIKIVQKYKKDLSDERDRATRRFLMEKRRISYEK